LDDFKRPGTVYLSFVALPRLTSAADTALARARADSVRAEIAGGAPFADVAKRESSDSVSAARGGDLGEWTRGSMDPAFDSAAFKLPLNKLSEPVLSQFGFHIIEVTSRKGDKIKGRHILIPVEVAGAHRDRLDAQADSLEKLGAEKSDPAALDTVARALKLPIGKSGPVQEGTKVQLGHLVVPDAAVWAFTAKPGQTSSVIETTVAYYVFRLDSLQEAGVPPIGRIRDAVAFQARAERKLERGREVARDYLKRVDAGGSMKAVADSMKLPYEEFGPFSRVSPPLDDPLVVGAAFGLDVGQRSGMLETKNGIYFVQVLEHTKADSAAFVKDLDTYRPHMIQLAQQDRVRGYLQALREAAKVVDDRKKVLRQTGAPGQTS
jgi:peptidyl-prolyl cis-trans isomerase D